MTFKNDLIKLSRLSPGEWVLLAQTFIWLGLIRIATALISFQRLAGWMGLSAGETSAPVTETQMKAANRIGWAVNAAALRTIWDSACLTQSLTCVFMLKRKKIPATVYLGVARNLNDQTFTAHAWLRCGDSILTGGGDIEKFNVIAVFSSAFSQ